MNKSKEEKKWKVEFVLPSNPSEKVAAAANPKEYNKRIGWIEQIDWIQLNMFNILDQTLVATLKSLGQQRQFMETLIQVLVLALT